MGREGGDEQRVMPKTFQPRLIVPHEIQQGVRTTRHEFPGQRVACVKPSSQKRIHNYYSRVQLFDSLLDAIVCLHICWTYQGNKGSSDNIHIAKKQKQKKNKAKTTHTPHPTRQVRPPRTCHKSTKHPTSDDAGIFPQETHLTRPFP